MIPLTHRGVSDSIHIISGRGEEGKFPEIPPFSDTKSIVLLMALKRIKPISKMFIEAGYPSSFPCAVISKSCWNLDSRTVLGTLESIFGLVSSSKIESPALWVVGNCVSNLLF